VQNEKENCIYFGGVRKWDWDLNSGLHACKVGTLLLEQHLQSILFWLFLELGSHELFAKAGLELQSSPFQPPK
jgi:hypothetical protein